jgi:hypothetical protein
LDFTKIERQFTGEFCQQAKESLVFLKNISRLEFSWRGVVEEGFELYWSVGREMGDTWTEDTFDQTTPLENLRSLELSITYSQPTSSASPLVTKWLIVSASIRQHALPRNVPYPEKLTSGQPTTKQNVIPDIAIATSQTLTTSQSGYYYNSLRMPASTGLPVHCHGQFSTTVDRRSLRIDAESGQWNKVLAEQCLPHLYFFLLERLAIRSPSNYYSFWPTVRANNTISYALQSEFWKKFPDCTRSIITTQPKNQCHVGKIIFDTREKRQWKASSDPIAEFVKIMLPDSHIIYEPTLNRALFTSDLISTERKATLHPKLQPLTPLFIRTQLRLPSAAAALAKFDDAALGSIIDFTLEEGPADNLIGCYGLRTAGGILFKLDRLPPSNEEIVANIVDNIGFKLFQDGHRRSLIKPGFLSDKALKILEQEQRLNIRRLDGHDIDRFVYQILPKCAIALFSASGKEWLTNLWEYIFAAGFTVSFYKSRPTLALEPAANRRFASFNGLKGQPILPSHTPRDLRLLCVHLPQIFLLAPCKLDAVSTVTAKWDCDERFLECLGIIVGGDTLKLTKLLRTNVRPTNLKVKSRLCNG